MSAPHEAGKQGGTRGTQSGARPSSISGGFFDAENRSRVVVTLVDTTAQTLSKADPSTRTLTGGALMCEALLADGVSTMFGYPGGAALPFYRELARYPRLRHVLVRHEQNAAHAADGYAHATGNVGVCCATSGPGATNLLTGLATAFMDCVPVVALTGQVARHAPAAVREPRRPALPRREGLPATRRTRGSRTIGPDERRDELERMLGGRGFLAVLAEGEWLAWSSSPGRHDSTAGRSASCTGSARTTSRSSTTPTSTGSPPRSCSRPASASSSTSPIRSPAGSRTWGRCCSSAAA